MMLSLAEPYKYYLEICEKLIKKGADINAVSDDKMSILQYAIDANVDCPNKKLIKLLIDNGANYLQKDNLGNTIFHNSIDSSYIAEYVADKHKKEIKELNDQLEKQKKVILHDVSNGTASVSHATVLQYI